MKRKLYTLLGWAPGLRPSEANGPTIKWNARG